MATWQYCKCGAALTTVKELDTGVCDICRSRKTKSRSVNWLLATVCFVLLAFVFVGFTPARAQSFEAPNWYTLPEQSAEIASVEAAPTIVLARNPQTDDIRIGERFTETVKVTAPTDSSMVLILFGFWYTPIPQANYVSASNSNCQLVALETVPHYECIVGPYQAGQEVEFAFVMEAVEPGSAKTYMGIEIWRQDNPSLPPFFDDNSIDWNVVPNTVLMSAGNAIGTLSEDYVEVPIWINSDVTDLGIHSFIFTTTINSNIVIPIYVRNAPLADTYGFQTDNVLLDAYTFVVNGYSTQDLAGKGIFLWIGFQVVETGYTPVNLKDFTFGEGKVEVTTSGGSITIEPPYVYGGAQYFYNGVPVPDVELELQGNGVFTDTTDNEGYFEIKVPGGNIDWELTARKTGDVCNAITPYDAYLINRCSLPGLRSCNPASDVTGNGTVTSEDAAQVAMFSVGLPAVPGVGLWSSFPVSYTLISLSESVEKHFVMSLAGDESGNWAFCHSTSAAAVQQANVEASVEKNIVNLTISTGNPIGGLKLNLEIAEGAQLTGVESDNLTVVQNDNVIGMFAQNDAVDVANVRLTFEVEQDSELSFSDILINEDRFTSDLVVDLLADEMPPLFLYTFLPQIEWRNDE